MPRTRSPRRLTDRASFWAAASVAAIALWASGAPSMVYPVYVAEWHLTPITITSIFAVYPITLVVILVIFGSLSDYVGRRAVLLGGLLAMALGILLFALAPNVGWLYAGRVLQGIGVGFAMSPASAAMVEYNRSENGGRASSINTASTALGLTLATIVGGALVQYAPWPAHLTYWVLCALTVGVFVVVWFMPRDASGAATVSGAATQWRPRGIRVAPGLGTVVLISAVAVTSGFAMGAIMLSLGSSIAKNLINTPNAFVAGVVISLSAVTIGISAILGRRLAPRVAITIGGLTTAFGMGLLVVSAITAQLPIFLGAAIIAGSGYGLLFLGGLGLINRHAPAHHRAQTFSVVYLIAYLLQGLIAVGVGLSATTIGLARAIDLWAPVVAGLCIAASVLALAVRGVSGRAACPDLRD